MRIGFDAKRAFHNYTGLGNYSRNIIKAFIEHYPNNEYFLFTPSIRHHDFYEEVKDLPHVKVIQPSFSFLNAIWRSFGISRLIKKLKLDVYHGLSNELPLNIKALKVKKIVTIHDLIPFKEDTFRNIFDDSISRLKMRAACTNADMITPISNATLHDIIKIFNREETKMKVVYQPLVFKHSSQLPEVKEKYGLPEKFILQVGRVEYRKNIQVVLRALIHLNDPSIHYVIVGRKTGFYKSLLAYGTNFGLKPQLHFIDPVSDDELAAIYNLCAGVMYPSLYEGFGLPIAEAIHFKKPVLTNLGGCFEEAGGPGAYYCDTNNPLEVASTITTLLSNDNSAMIQDGQEYIYQFTSKAAADQLMEIYLK